MANNETKIDYPEIVTETFEKIRLVGKQEIDLRQLESLTRLKQLRVKSLASELNLASAHIDDIMGRLLIEFQTAIYGKKQEGQFYITQDIPKASQEHKQPKNWLQHFKQDVFPIWLLKIFPVKYTAEIVKSETTNERKLVKFEWYKVNPDLIGNGEDFIYLNEYQNININWTDDH